MPCRPACWTPAGATSGGTRPACYLSSTGQPSRDTTVRFEIDAYPDDEPEDTFTNTRLLIDYALACKAEELVFLYRWDLKWCPVFGKLKTLLLNKWFTAIDLVCILQHSPVLEMLTLRFDNTKVDSAYFVTKLASRRIHVRTQIIRLLIVTPLIATKMCGRS
ncbi:uncharacterized protein LOC119318385 isoform X2 [Triticum dicoccoides]|uniref:uncharacterized protein LOC119318385 isoform X2 n=1 Tax=Triticum dicoccoides TaxID=85692 RepID=UPI00189177F8|nr:uncharacterized protein LOC119318385 isoform X2 [Triticum dicoccoides]